MARSTWYWIMRRGFVNARSDSTGDDVSGRRGGLVDGVVKFMDEVVDRGKLETAEADDEDGRPKCMTVDGGAQGTSTMHALV